MAIPRPLAGLWDYLPLSDGPTAVVGARVLVPVGRSRCIGVVCAHRNTESPDAAPAEVVLRAVLENVDAQSVLDAESLALMRWAADYYRHPLGQVLMSALPPLLRGAEPLPPLQLPGVRLTDAGRGALSALPARAAKLRTLLQGAERPIPRPKADATLRRALEDAWLSPCDLPLPAHEARPLTPGQAQALAALPPPGKAAVTLLEGVTGSGKTEVYLAQAAEALLAGQQVLILVPEIGLTPQVLGRFKARFGHAALAYHSGMGEAERLQTWLALRDGLPRVVIGTRSAIWLPFVRLGLLVVDEEHDASYKQQDGFRYHARDIAVLRGQRSGAAVVLGTATPSLETLHNALRGRYAHVRLASPAVAKQTPRLAAIDLNLHPPRDGISAPLAEAIQRHHAAGGQVLLFVNRRGFAPVLFCPGCRWTAPCPYCDARLAVRPMSRQLQCHHCGYQAPQPQCCPECGGALMPLGEGTERVEAAVQTLLPGVRVERFDSDRFASARAVASLLEEVHSGAVPLLVGTQMLAKGHDLQKLSLVGIVHADSGLYATDFRASERLLQLLTQVAGRAGRAAAPPHPPEVLWQTRDPQHPLWALWQIGGYAGAAQSLLQERLDAGLPPGGHLALLRAEAASAGEADRVLRDAVALAPPLPQGVSLWGPAPAPMAKMAGRWRAQVLIQSQSRAALHGLLAAWQPTWAQIKAVRRVRLGLDIDPADLY